MDGRHDTIFDGYNYLGQHPEKDAALVCQIWASIATRETIPAQVALTWLFAKKPWIVPIPGTRKLDRMVENIGAAEIALTSGDLREIDSAFDRGDLKVRDSPYQSAFGIRNT